MDFLFTDFCAHSPSTLKRDPSPDSTSNTAHATPEKVCRGRMVLALTYCLCSILIDMALNATKHQLAVHQGQPCVGNLQLWGQSLAWLKERSTACSLAALPKSGGSTQKPDSDLASRMSSRHKRGPCSQLCGQVVKQPQS